MQSYKRNLEFLHFLTQQNSSLISIDLKEFKTNLAFFKTKIILQDWLKDFLQFFYQNTKKTFSKIKVKDMFEPRRIITLKRLKDVFFQREKNINFEKLYFAFLILTYDHDSSFFVISRGCRWLPFCLLVNSSPDNKLFLDFSFIFQLN